MYADDAYGKKVVEFLDNGTFEELSIGYPLYRDPKTKIVSRLGIDEFSLVDEAHFQGCRVNFKANRSNSVEMLPKPGTIYRRVMAGKLGLGDLDNNISNTIAAFESSTAAKSSLLSAAPKRMAQQEKPAATFNLDDDLKNVSAPNELVKGIAQLSKQFSARETELGSKLNDIEKELQDKDARLADAAAKLKEYEEQLRTVQEAKRADREAHAKASEPRVDAIIKDLMSIAAEAKLPSPSGDWAKMMKMTLTDNSPVSKEMQAVQIAASNKHKAQSVVLAKSQARIKELEQLLQEGGAMLKLEEVAHEQERYERRDTKAANRRPALMQPASSTPAPSGGGGGLTAQHPAWVHQFANSDQYLGGNAMGYVRPAERQQDMRGVAAGRRPSAPPSGAAQTPSGTEQQQQNRQVTRLPGAPSNSHSMSQDPANREIFFFMQDLMGTTEHNSGAGFSLAGKDFDQSMVHMMDEGTY